MAEETMPPGYDNVKSEVPYHFLYHKCDKCEGYNTKVLGTFKRTTSGTPKMTENSASAGDPGNVPANNGATETTEGGNTATHSTIVHIPEIPRTPQLDGNSAENMGSGGEIGSSRSSGP
ncbi:hypothetical protein BGZ76_002513 [Entomortierella beljakovae]|nr:hypothetical protein BGZ76_002513 [Entomortierella beljakovae]